jgi:hypothetical protein
MIARPARLPALAALVPALALLALLIASPASQAGGRPIPMVEQVDVPLNWLGGPPGSLEVVRKAVLLSLTATGWEPTLLAPDKAHAVRRGGDWRCEIEVTFDTKTFSLRYFSSERLDYDARRHVIHRNFNPWLLQIRDKITQNMGYAALPGA